MNWNEQQTKWRREILHYLQNQPDFRREYFEHRYDEQAIEELFERWGLAGIVVLDGKIHLMLKEDKKASNERP